MIHSTTVALSVSFSLSHPSQSTGHIPTVLNEGSKKGGAKDHLEIMKLPIEKDDILIAGFVAWLTLVFIIINLFIIK